MKKHSNIASLSHPGGQKKSSARVHAQLHPPGRVMVAVSNEQLRHFFFAAHQLFFGLYSSN